ncbi:hypothetical protein [Pseudomonas citronellolis]|uniref:hypothetical protein n=1 Tax=Pseudomonas citronellolis TaxID=53408 RepID=UPI000718966E|nr:hypothetical protein [Pseudomonas citronellolis]KRV76362.1 hypothetical protein AO742_12580 [Pseudomonas citronellolis]KRW79603.1 hypothetical protein AO738_13685 [Pseudomonas citronellolis]
MSDAQRRATARYKAKQVRVDALINPETEPELAQAWQRLLARFGGSKKKAIEWAILHSENKT